MGKGQPTLNRKTAGLLLIGLYLLVTVTAAIANTATNDPRPRGHISPAMRLATMLPSAAEIGMAVAVVPDPRVPRYRRPYDLGLVAIELGMLKNGYVLDRFYLPWNEGLGNPNDPAGSTANWAAYGIMVFRCDAWRAGVAADQKRNSPEDPGAVPKPDCETSANSSLGTRFRVLYVVTDTSTRGVAGASLSCVIQRIESQLPRTARTGVAVYTEAEPNCERWPETDSPTPSPAAPPAIQLLAHRGGCPNASAATLVILGPTFSGSLDSVGAGTEKANRQASEISDFCVISSSASDSTNGRIVNRYTHMSFKSLALDQNRRLRDLAGLVTPLMGANPGEERERQVQAASKEVAILAEASTFGYGFCNPGGVDDHAQRWESALCNSAKLIFFPANIADIRYGLQQQRDQQHAQTNSVLRSFSADQHLPLQLGAENGSEFPESRQSQLTSTSLELALDEILETLRSANPQPRVIVVVATDVRDRLFLFDELRSRVPRALLVDVEADNLLGHPDFLHSSRGALAIATSRLTENEGLYGCEPTGLGTRNAHDRPYFMWSSDVQAMFSDAVKGLSEQTQVRDHPGSCVLDSETASLRHATMHVVTLEGLKPVGKGYEKRASPARHAIPAEPADLAQPAPSVEAWAPPLPLRSAEFGAPVLCLVGAWLWIVPLFPRLLPKRLPLLRGNAIAAFGYCIVYGVLLIDVAASWRKVDYDNPVVYWAAAGATGGLAGLFVCVRILYRARQAAPKLSYKNALLPAFLAVCAMLLALTPFWWLHTANATYGVFADVEDLMALALNPDQGMAFVLLVALATLALLYASVVLSTSAAITNRNSTLLRLAQWQVQHGPVPMDPAQLGGAPNYRGTPNLNLPLLSAAALLIGIIAVPKLLTGDVRLTIFGHWVSIVALLALLATTGAAALLACSALGAVRRINSIARYLEIGRTPALTSAAPARPATANDLWSHDGLAPRVFPATPIVAMLRDGGKTATGLHRASNLSDWTQGLQEWLQLQDTSKQRLAVFALLATEISIYRWSLIGAAACALASVGAVYLFPIEADQLLLLNLLLLMVLGLVAGYTATAFERNQLLTNILCNRAAKRRFSTPLFLFIALPFVAFAAAVAIANIPGVVDWGGGIMQLLTAIGIHP